MNDKSRVGLTWMFWIVGIVMTLLFMLGVGMEILSDWVVIVPLIVTLFATVTLWGVDTNANSNKELPAQQPHNTKQGDNTAYTMALLMEMMDEDERQTFKERLQERILSGEVVGDESLIADMEKRKRG